MKKIKNITAILLISFLIIILLPTANAFAVDTQSYTSSTVIKSEKGNNALNAPTIESMPATVNAFTYVIKGITYPNAKVTIMGGPYDLAPFNADSNGNFALEVALLQDKVNRYIVKVESDKKFSPSVTIYIVESGAGKTVKAVPVETVETETETPTTTTTSTTSTTTSTSKVITVQSFTDVKKTDWFHDHIDKLRKRGVISGYTNGNFGPSDPITRGQMMKITCNATGLNMTSFKKTLAFSDVKNDNPFLKCIHAANQKGWINGYANGNFGVNDKVTRAQASKIIVNAFELDLYTPAKPTFPDVKATEWFYPYVETLVHHKILSGYPNGTFKPGNILNRAEISKITIKAAENSAVGVSAGFSSVALNKDDCKVIAKISSVDEASLAKSLSDQETLSSLIANFKDTYDAAKEISIASDIQLKIKEGKTLTMQNQAFVNMANAKKEYEILLKKAKDAQAAYNAIVKKAIASSTTLTPEQKAINKTLASKLTKMTQLNSTASSTSTETEIVNFLDIIPVTQIAATNEYKNESEKALGKWWGFEEDALKRYKEYLQAEKVYVTLWLKSKTTNNSSFQKYLADLDRQVARVKKRVNKSGKTAIEGAKKQCLLLN